MLNLLPSLLLLSLTTHQDTATTPPADELVRNGGFEWVGEKPPTVDGLKDAVGWGNVTLGLSELFSRESKEKDVGIPVNLYGTMEPFEGEHYAGFFAWKDDQRRNWEGGTEDPFKPGWSVYSEYLQSELVKPLLRDSTYELVFRVALSANSDRAVSALGAYCSPRQLEYGHRRFLEEKPQVYVEEIQSEKGKWVEVKGRFVADGGERFIVIGTWPYAGFETRRVVEEHDNQYAYYYLDGISLRRVPGDDE